MSPRDALAIALGNLRRMKLRAGLTTAGIVIAIGAFVSMLSFGAGNHRLVSERAESLGLLNTMQVYPGAEEDSLAAVLDAAAVERLQALPGVRLAYPLNALGLDLARGEGESRRVEAQALTPSALATKLFSHYRAGGPPGDEREVLVTEKFLDLLDLSPADADSLVGDSLFVSLQVASLDSALVRALAPGAGRFFTLLSTVDIDSLRDPDYRRQLARRELGEAVTRFVDGYLHGRVLRDTLVVSGVLEGLRSGRNLRVKPLILSPERAARFQRAGRPAEPLTLLAALERGELFEPESAAVEAGYAQVTLDMDPFSPYESLRDTVTALGYRSFSFAEQFVEIRRMFLFFQLGLAAVGLVALATAALGIVNTMLMSISERRREIGLLKSLGADEREIRGLFLAESALIGAMGSALGILLGWIVARLASLIARTIMTRQGVPELDLFATPLWLVLGSFAFGILVSLIAGAAPAARAARVDPVQALRSD